jgi:hypothetical protein
MIYELKPIRLPEVDIERQLWRLVLLSCAAWVVAIAMLAGGLQ